MKTSIKALAFVLALGAAAFATPEAAGAQQARTIRCESSNNRMQTCPVPNLDEGSVRLSRRLSQSECVNGRSWGTRAGEIWVTNGCRAEFVYQTAGRPPQGGGRNQITCESQGGALQVCRIPGLNQGSVRLVERLSQAQCVNGDTWGTNADGIWVEGGCRARFEYQTRGAGGTSEANNPGRRMEITCESRNNARQECYISNLDLSSVRLERNLSRTPCNLDQTFGASRNRQGTRFFIWVDQGCRGVFSYRVNR